MPLFSDEDFEKALSEVSSQRRERVLRFRFKEGRHQSLMAYLLLKRLLKTEYGLNGNPLFIVGEHGKPEISQIETSDGQLIPAPEPAIHFSMSHCKNGVACAVSPQPVGIDIERIQPVIKESLCRYVLSEEELSQVLSSQQPNVAFTRLWTMKESLVKLLGTGISSGEQLRELLTKQAATYTFRTEINEARGWVMTVCEPKVE